jgi:hypothetical protein
VWRTILLISGGVMALKTAEVSPATVSDAIYLNKRGSSSDLFKWVYYRVTSRGTEGDDIQVCLLTWPSFEDFDVIGDEQKAVVVNPGDTGFSCAYQHLLTLLKEKWKIEHSDNDLIGVRVRNV